MIQWISSWASGIVVAVFLATLIEMLLPNGNNKKYVKTVIGIFVLFSIIAPIIDNISSTHISQEVDFAIEEQEKIEEIDTNKNIEEVYRKNMEQDIKNKLQEKGYQIEITALSIHFVEGEDYGKVNQIHLKVIQEKTEESNSIKTVENIEKVEIAIGNREQLEEETISEESKKEIKNFLMEEYKIEEENIYIG